MEKIKFVLLGSSVLAVLLPGVTTAQPLAAGAAQARLIIRHPQTHPDCPVELFVGGVAAARLPGGAQVVLNLPAGETNLATRAGAAPDCPTSGAGGASQSVLLRPGETRRYDASGPFLSPSDAPSSGKARQ